MKHHRTLPSLLLPEDEPTAVMDEERRERLLEQVDWPDVGTSVRTLSGNRYELSGTEKEDRVEVRSPGGKVVLSLRIEGGVATLVAEAVALTLSADDLHLRGRRVRVEAEETLHLSAGAHMRVESGGDRHTTVAGADRLEAAEVSLQASDGAIGARASGAITLDGEHIGLNDDPCPAPFAWSRAASFAEDRS